MSYRILTWTLSVLHSSSCFHFRTWPPPVRFYFSSSFPIWLAHSAHMPYVMLQLFQQVGKEAFAGMFLDTGKATMCLKCFTGSFKCFLVWHISCFTYLIHTGFLCCLLSYFLYHLFILSSQVNFICIAPIHNRTSLKALNILSRSRSILLIHERKSPQRRICKRCRLP